MNNLLAILVLNFLCKNACIDAHPSDHAPEWSPQYTIKGVVTHSNGEITEPFEAWYDWFAGSSRVDYYGGIVSQYQLSGEGEFGRFYRFIPVTINGNENVRICQQIDVRRNFSADNINDFKRIDPQSVLPDLQEFTFDGTQMIFGRKCHRFVLDHGVTRLSMWVHYKRIGKKYQRLVEYVPMLYELLHFNSEGNIIVWHRIEYTSYKSTLNHLDLNEIFSVHDKGCEVFPYYKESLFNRIRSFLYSRDDVEHNTYNANNGQAYDSQGYDSQFDHITTEHQSFEETTEYPVDEDNDADGDDNDHDGDVDGDNTDDITDYDADESDIEQTIDHQFNDQTIEHELPDDKRVENQVENDQRVENQVENSQTIEHHVEDGQPLDYDIWNFDEMSIEKELDVELYANLPESFDWRLLGAVTAVRDQSHVCGSCWAISAGGAVEGALYVRNGMEELVRLSEQALIDCSWEYGSVGCGGGFDYQAYGWIKDYGGIPTDESYGKYKAMEDICHANDPDVVLEAPIAGWVNVQSRNSNAMKLALYENGPISVIIHTTDLFLNYVSSNASEIFYDPDCVNTTTKLNHAVLVVGYGKSEEGEEYWIIKNSYGVNWGLDGFVLMSARDNHCGVLTQPLYPIID